jgi:hypothetical protein
LKTDRCDFERFRPTGWQMVDRIPHGSVMHVRGALHIVDRGGGLPGGGAQDKLPPYWASIASGCGERSGTGWGVQQSWGVGFTSAAPAGPRGQI